MQNAINGMRAAIDDRTYVLTRVEAALQYNWRDQRLLITALQHTSWCNENRPSEPNERLEFLGDSVLDLLVADHLFRSHAHKREGFLSDQRARRVRTESLAAIARRYGLNRCLYLGRGSQALRENDGTLADLVEALFGAAYLDGGLSVVRQIALRVGVL